MVDIRHLLPFCLVVICPLFEELSFSEFSITCEMQMLKAEKGSFFCIWTCIQTQLTGQEVPGSLLDSLFGNKVRGGTWKNWKRFSAWIFRIKQIIFTHDERKTGHRDK